MRNAELVRVLSSVGLRDVTAVISSGNFLFDSDERDRSVLQELIEAALHDHLGTTCSTIVRRSAPACCEPSLPTSVQ